MSLADDIRRAMEYMLQHVHTGLPGEIQSYDHNTRLAKVQPLINRKYADGLSLVLPIISNVPVGFPSTKRASVTLGLERGDTGWLHFSERCIDGWVLNGGGVQDPAVPRRHALSDAVFYPGIGPGKPGKPGTNKNFELITADASIVVDGASIVIKDSAGGQINLTAGTIAAGTSANELMAILTQAFTALSTAQTVGESEPLTSAPVLALVLARLAAIQGALT